VKREPYVAGVELAVAALDVTEHRLEPQRVRVERNTALVLVDQQANVCQVTSHARASVRPAQGVRRGRKCFGS
jgi:hypothetical protein